jgi:REase_DpnII-MboI
MFVERTEHDMGKPRWKYETNLSKEQILDQFLLRYLSNNNVICDGYIFHASEITNIKVFETATELEFDKKASHLDFEKDRVINEQGKDVTRILLDEANKALIEHKQSLSNPTTEALEWFEKLSSKFRNMSLILERRKTGKSPFIIEDESDFQDLLRCFLSIEFNDVRPEEYVPEYAGASAKIDFLLPEVSLSVETKYVTEKHGRKKIGEELLIDSAKYRAHPKCDILVCLVYDPKFLLENKLGFISDLESDPNLKVRVFVIQ